MEEKLWRAFPQLLVQKINALLDEAVPRPTKAFHLYKACQRENLWKDSFEKFQEQLTSFFGQPRSDRAKSGLDCVMERPMNHRLYEEFQLNFRTAAVSSRQVIETATWAHHMMRSGCHTESAVISSDTLTRTLHDITDPAPFEKDQDIEFEDFCISWKKIVFQLFGKKHDEEMQGILKELRWLNAQLKKPQGPRFVPGIYLTQTEISWTEQVLKSAEMGTEAPEFPLSRGARKPRLIELERAAELYNLVRKSERPEIRSHLENVRVTILDKCDWLLKQKAG